MLTPEFHLLVASLERQTFRKALLVPSQVVREEERQGVVMAQRGVGMKLGRFIVAAGVVGSVLAASLITAVPAQAATSDCYYYDVCLYYNSSAYGFGAVYDQGVNVSDYAGRYFSCGNNGCAGSGQVVKNNAAALDSWWYYRFEIFYNNTYNCSHACEIFPAYATFVNFNSTMKNQNASGKFLSS
jgi:hypothetical protein